MFSFFSRLFCTGLIKSHSCIVFYHNGWMFQLLQWGDKLTAESLQFFSPIVIWTRPNGRDDIQTTVFPAFQDYLMVCLLSITLKDCEGVVLKFSCNKQIGPYQRGSSGWYPPSSDVRYPSCTWGWIWSTWTSCLDMVLFVCCMKTQSWKLDIYTMKFWAGLATNGGECTTISR